MKKTLFLIVALLVANLSANAQDDAKGKAIVDKLMAAAKTWTSFEADFSSRLQSTKDKLDVKQEGNMKVKGKKFRLQLDKNTVINDGTTMIFTQYEKGFKVQFVEEKTDATGTVVQVVKLFPTDAGKKPYHTVVLTVDKAKNEPKSVQVLYKDGNIVTYTLKKFTANAALADALFTFDKAKYPGVEVNDMR
jgi:outer membrane lipoprotein-sorting protein